VAIIGSRSNKKRSSDIRIRLKRLAATSTSVTALVVDHLQTTTAPADP
jgi:hypothetical protein